MTTTRGTGARMMATGLLAALLTVAVPWSPAWAQGLLPYQDADAVARGKAVYDGYCAACHGADLEGEPDWWTRDADGYLPAPPHDETGHTWHHPDMQLLQITWLGTEAIVGNGYKSRMMGFQDVLTPDEVAEVLAYIKSTWPAHIIERHNEVNASAATAAQ